MKQKHLIIGGVALVLLLLAGNVSAASSSTSPEDADFSYLGQSGKPRGMRNNNPLNIKINPSNQWQGRSTPNTDGVFEQFVSYKYGIRAAMVLLKNYINQGKDTVQLIISKWAPGGTSENNPVTAYVNHVADVMGVAPTTKLGFNFEDVAGLVVGMASFENGVDDAVTYGQAASVWQEFFEKAISGTRKTVVNKSYLQL
jgi:hypothetical protein